VAATLAYVLGWVSGLLFYFIDSSDDFVRFHAAQSIILFGGATVLSVILWLLLRVPYVSILFMVLLSLVGLFAFALWLILMVKAYQRERFSLPWIGALAERYSKRESL
jgi:uncharacterized membrane protein